MTARLEKRLTLRNGVSLVLGTMIGSGIFASPGVVYERVGSSGASIVVWIVCGVVAYIGSLCYAELGSTLPESGAEVAYLKRSFGSLSSFLFSWTNSFVSRPASLAIIALVFGEYLGKLVDAHDETLPKILSVCCVGVVTALNAHSVAAATASQDWLTLLKIIILLVIIVAGIVRAARPAVDGAVDDGSAVADDRVITFDGSSRDLRDWSDAFQAGLFGYDGWNNLAYATEELKDPSFLVRSIRVAVPVVLALYVGVNLAYFAVLDSATIVASDALGMDFAVNAFGDVGRIIMPVCVALSAFGACLGTMFAASRLVHKSSSDGNGFPSCLGVVHPSRATPMAAILCQGTLAVLLLLVGDFEELVDYFGCAAWFFYFLTVLGLLKLRHTEPNLERPYTTARITPYVFCAVAFGLFSFDVVSSPSASLTAIGFMLTGVPIWYWRVHKGNTSRLCCDFSSSSAGARVEPSDSFDTLSEVDEERLGGLELEMA